MDKDVLNKIESFFIQYKHQVYKKGEILIRANDDPPGIFFIKMGTVRQYAISKKGDELVVNMFKPTAFFPMSWAINNTPNDYFFEAIEDIEVWKAPKEKVVEFIKTNPDVLYDLIRRVYIGTDGILLRMVYLMSGNAYSRLITELLIHARRFGEKATDSSSYELHLTESDLAMQAGMTRETVSREIKILKGKGLVQMLKNSILIPEIGKLEEELSGEF